MGRLRQLERRRHRHRLLRPVLDVDLEVVLQVLAHAGQVGDHVDAEPAEQLGRAHAGQLQQLRRVDRAAAQDDLAPRASRAVLRPGPPRRRPLNSTPTARAPSKRILVTKRAAGHVEVGPAHHRVQVGPGRARAAGRGGCSGRTRRSPPAGSRSRRRSAGTRPAAPRRRTPGTAGWWPARVPAPAGRRRPGTRPPPARQVSILLKYGRQCA